MHTDLATPCHNALNLAHTILLNVTRPSRRGRRCDAARLQHQSGDALPQLGGLLDV